MNHPTLQGRRVLVIEDTEQNMRLFRAILQMEGAEVLEAAGARAGIALAEREHPDIILMDIQMPGMDGLAATRLLRSQAVTRDIRIIAVTASVMDEDRDKTFEAGCDGFITKPIDPDNFGSQVAAYLQPN
jgi:two-component system cell cycle response regulator DivK